jgi:uncharacterized membrane protein YbjE (DUF340 family)
MVDLVALVVLVLPLVAGVGLGYLLRGKRRANLGKVTFGVILVLIFSLGFSMGSNSELRSSLPTVGLSAFVIMILAVGFSVILIKAVGKVVKIN